MIDAVGAAGATPTDAGRGVLDQMGSDAFLKLLVAQLRYQNPMSPGDGTEFLQQTAQFTTVETLQAISAANQQMMGLQQVTMSLAIVGKHASAITVDGDTIEGVVGGVRFTADGPLVEIGHREVPIDNVIEVRTAEE